MDYLNQPGFSRMLDSEPIRLALKKQRRAVLIAELILVLLPLVGFAVYGALSDSTELGQALLYGLVISAVFAFTVIIVEIRKKLTKPFVGSVSDKKKRLRISGKDGRRTRIRRIVWFDCEDGRRRKKEVQDAVYEFLQIGDRVRFLPQFPQPFEKYRTGADTELLCVFCGRLQPIGSDRCSYCKNPLLK